jgi:hypothetical protein
MSPAAAPGVRGKKLRIPDLGRPAKGSHGWRGRGLAATAMRIVRRTWLPINYAGDAALYAVLYAGRALRQVFRTSITGLDADTQPKIPPCALIMARPAA